MTLPLAGIRVLDVTNVLAGPFCSYQLALLGAEVIKIEQPGRGDLARMLGADPEAATKLMGASFVAVNAGKQSVTLNLKTLKGKEIFKKFAAISHAVIENFRPDVMKRLQHVRPEILDNGMRDRSKFFEYFFTFQGLQVQRDGLFACVDRHEGSAHQLRCSLRISAKHSRQIAAPGLFDLDHLGAKQSKLIAAEWPGEDIGDV